MSTAEAWTVGRLLTWTADYLKKNGSNSPRLDAEVLLAEARGCERIELYTAFTEEPSEQVRASFKEMVRRRAEGTPVAYLVGRKEFFSLSFEINPDVLIPRPETEHLVVEAIDRAKILQPNTRLQSPGQLVGTEMPEREPAGGAGEGLKPRPKQSFKGLSVADVGTGSGCVAIALAKSLPDAKITALEISPAAIALAQRNAERLGLASQATVVQSNLLSAVADRHFDIIVSNPPYITDAEYEQLPKPVRNYEPRGALVGGPNGTEIIAQLLAQAAPCCRHGGWLLIEISPMIADSVRAMVDRTLWSEPTLVKDLAGHVRIVAMARL